MVAAKSCSSYSDSVNRQMTQTSKYRRVFVKAVILLKTLVTMAARPKRETPEMPPAALAAAQPSYVNRPPTNPTESSSPAAN